MATPRPDWNQRLDAFILDPFSPDPRVAQQFAQIFEAIKKPNPLLNKGMQAAIQRLQQDEILYRNFVFALARRRLFNKLVLKTHVQRGRVSSSSKFQTSFQHEKNKLEKLEKRAMRIRTRKGK